MSRLVKVIVANIICNPWAGRKTLVHPKALATGATYGPVL